MKPSAEPMKEIRLGSEAYISLDDYAKATGRARNSVASGIERGAIPLTRFYFGGRKPFLRVSEISALVEASAVPSGSRKPGRWQQSRRKK